MRSYDAQASKARQAKIEGLLDSGLLDFCEAQYQGLPVRLHFWFGRNPDAKTYAQASLIYLEHPFSLKPVAADFRWKRTVNKEEVEITPTLQHTYVLPTRSLSVLIADSYLSFPYMAPGVTCHTRDAKRAVAPQKR